MLKKRLVALVAGVALVVAVAGASAGVANSLAAWTAPTGQAIACNHSGSSGGGC